MKYYQELSKHPTFTLEMASEIMGSKINAPKYLYNMSNKGCINKIRKNLYTCVDLATGEDLATRFIIASNITGNSFISYHTAFEFYGFYNQLFYDVQICSISRFTDFEYDGFLYKCLPVNNTCQVNEIQEVRVASVERTIIDSINMLGKVMDVEELIKCMDLVHIINEKNLIEMLSLYDKDILYRKAGYILSFYREEYGLSESFFEFCRSHSNTKNKGMLSRNEIRKLEYIPEWGIYGFRNLRDVTSKGGNIDV